MICASVKHELIHISAPIVKLSKN